MSGKLHLVITPGPMTGKALTFTEHDTLLCGRQSDCHICLPDDRRISCHRFLLEVNPPDARIRDYPCASSCPADSCSPRRGDSSLARQ